MFPKYTWNILTSVSTITGINGDIAQRRAGTLFLPEISRHFSRKGESKEELQVRLILMVISSWSWLTEEC